MTQLHNEFSKKFQDASSRQFVVSHNAFEYIARDYGLKQYPLQGLTSMEQPSVRSLVDAIHFVQDAGITTLFYEYGSLPLGADTIAEEVDGETVPLASMEYVSPGQTEEADGYVGFMRMNLENIYESLEHRDESQ